MSDNVGLVERIWPVSGAEAEVYAPGIFNVTDPGELSELETMLANEVGTSKVVARYRERDKLVAVLQKVGGALHIIELLARGVEMPAALTDAWWEAKLVCPWRIELLARDAGLIDE